MSAVTNHQLFSHAFLAQLQNDPANDEAAAPIAQGLRDWLPSRDGSTLRSLMDSWVGPVLDFLDFCHAPAHDAPYIHLLYAHRADETPVGLCYVVPPGQDGSTGSPRGLDDTLKGRHPLAQAVLALRARRLRWGMLTDGTHWRLLDAESLHRYEHYLEVNVDELARSNDPISLRLFYACFHRHAFASSPLPALGEGPGVRATSPLPALGEGPGVRAGLDQLLAASERATQAAEDHLKARVSHNEGILAQLCLGLVRADGRARYSEAERDAIYQDATTLLYRMLFILYAEARTLLPMDNPAYRAVSLSELVKTARAYKLHGMPNPQATTLWECLKRLCTAIYESDPALGIPAYNGGLFDDADKPYLQRGSIADMHLAEALFDLAYRPDSAAPDGYQPLDYRDLSVRHLGSLYEGMIEYKLQIAEETLWARRDGKGNVRFLRAGQEGAPRKTDAEITPGQVYFSQSPGERHATGTYYTPEYIVDYIVRQTVVRGLEERRAPLEAKLKETSEVVRTCGSPETLEVLDEELLRFVEEEVLTFRVCDPAMGSGHFLVNAAHQMANFIVETLHLTPWPAPPTAPAGPQSGGLHVDTDPLTWRRQVVERCLYGVDLSRMAVELAKLSLWLASVAQDRPLSFLDHHLRQGNSLVGARLADLAAVLAGPAPAPSKREEKQRAAGQLSMLDDPAFRQHVTVATDLLSQITACVAETLEDIKTQVAGYARVRAEMELYRQLADLWVARYFGVDIDDKELALISRYILNGTIANIPAYETARRQAERIGYENHFFHWPLEFPTVFLGTHSDAAEAGFDVIVGNPPYGAQLSKSHRRFFWDCSRFGQGRVDTYMFFFEKALSTLNSGGRLSLIVPNVWLASHYGLKLRELFLSHTQIESILDCSEVDVFPDATIATVVPVLRKQSEPMGDVQILKLHQDRSVSRSHRVSQVHWKANEQSILTISQSNEIAGLVDKIGSRGIPLEDICRVSQGIIVYQTKAQGKGNPFVGEPRKCEEWVPFLDMAECVDRYSLSWRGLYLRWGEWLCRPRERAFFVNPKILFHRLRKTLPVQLVGAFDDGGYFNKSALNNIILRNDVSGYDLRYVLALFNSTLLNFWFVQTYGKLIEVNVFKVSSLPICPISRPGSDEEQVNLATEKLKQSYSTVLLCGSSSGSSLDLGTVSNDPAWHDFLVFLAQQMIDLHKARQRLEREADLFRFVPPDTPCLPLDRVLGGPLGTGEVVSDLSVVRHDIEGLRLSQEVGADSGGRPGRWLLEVRAKLRNPDSGWRVHQRDRDGNFIRRWLPVAHLPLDEATGRFYHYAFAHLDGFTGAGRFPGGSTRTTLEKLKATLVPRFVPVDLAPLAVLEAELAEVRRKIRLTDDLIDQIVYKLYGLTEEEIAIVEGRA